MLDGVVEAFVVHGMLVRRLFVQDMLVVAPVVADVGACILEIIAPPRLVAGVMLLFSIGGGGGEVKQGVGEAKKERRGGDRQGAVDENDDCSRGI
jgi:hypothetical protein